MTQEKAATNKKKTLWNIDNDVKKFADFAVKNAVTMFELLTLRILLYLPYFYLQDYCIPPSHSFKKRVCNVLRDLVPLAQF